MILLIPFVTSITYFTFYIGKHDRPKNKYIIAWSRKQSLSNSFRSLNNISSYNRTMRSWSLKQNFKRCLIIINITFTRKVDTNNSEQ